MLSRRHLLQSAAALGGLTLSGCNVIPNVNQPLDLYTLKPQVTFDQPLPKVTWQLVIAEPVAERDINTTRIALTRAPNSIEYFAKGNWTDTAPSLVQAKLIEAFETTDSIVAIGRDASGLKPDYILQSDLRDFQAEFSGATGASDGAPNVHVRLIAKLVQMPERRIVRTVSAEQSVAAAANTVPAVVTAFEQALSVVLKTIVQGTLTQS
jgi:cholesterol transport system auxiliary component